MKIVLNWVYFVGKLLMGGAVFFKSSVPAFTDMRDANAKNRYISELDSAIIGEIKKIESEVKIG